MRTSPLSVDDQIDATPAEPSAPADDRQSRPVAPGRRAPRASESGLAFDACGGPLVVVCGLHGGAGTSTLAYTLAAQAGLESDSAVLVCEADSVAGDISAIASTTSPCSAGDLAIELRAGRSPTAFLARQGNLRLIATAPDRRAVAEDGALVEVLTAARASHGLTVVDAGTLRTPCSREALAAATHVVWVTTITRATAAGRLLASPLVPSLSARQLLAVRAGRRARKRRNDSSRDVRALAAAHCDRLVFIPENEAPADLGKPRTQQTLTAIATFLS